LYVPISVSACAASEHPSSTAALDAFGGNDLASSLKLHLPFHVCGAESGSWNLADRAGIRASFLVTGTCARCRWQCFGPKYSVSNGMISRSPVLRFATTLIAAAQEPTQPVVVIASVTDSSDKCEAIPRFGEGMKQIRAI
jgi:hypothetical protein